MSFAVITPSYAPDYERCRLLCETLDKHCSSKYSHYLIVDRKDLSLFNSLKANHRHIITVESILPWWIRKSPFKNGWISFKSLPLRNWIVQQLVKLSMANFVDEEVLIFVDSDVAFIKSFDLNDFVQDESVRLFREPNAVNQESELGKWTGVATDLLQIPAIEYPASNYLGNCIVWRRDCVLALYAHLEKVHGKPWLEVIANSWHLSEYALYGTFVEFVMNENNHYYDSQLICHNYWETTPMNENQILDFFAEVPEQCFAVMISAKSDTDIKQIIPYAMLDYGKTTKLSKQETWQKTKPLAITEQLKA